MYRDTFWRNLFLVVFQLAAIREIIGFDRNRFMNFDLFGFGSFGSPFSFFGLPLFAADSRPDGLIFCVGFWPFNPAVSSLKN